ncbi:hypothetical protein Taro_000152 [Colocasia esculenta]|uniref:Uncharacterized protein n=1 Tax=Colocasia esculenta TaxID=4460 RepID=A0A843TFW2_COLES|nr:hypothetical protein [Colocasia esculenta]
MERHKPIPQPFFPCCIRTPKTHRCLNTLNRNPRDEFRTCWGRVEELLVAGELWIIHKKLIFFPCSSATTCTNRPLEVDQRARRVSKGSSLAPMTSSPKYIVNHGAPKLFHEELLFSIRMEDGKKVHTRHLPHIENVTVEDDVTRDASGCSDALPASSRQVRLPRHQVHLLYPSIS